MRIRPVVVSAILIPLTGCGLLGMPTRSTTPAGTPTGAPVSASVSVPPPSRATPSPAVTTVVVTVSPTVRPPSPSASRAWPKVQGEAGGGLSLNGKPVTRDGPAEERAVLAAMGTPDQKTERTTCGTTKLKNTLYRWGDLQVVVLREADTSWEYGFAYPPGSIAGWRIDPALDGKPGLAFAATGPKGTTIGTTLATLRQRFPTTDWDYASVDVVRGKRVFSFGAGDTTTAAMDLDAADKVSAMYAGYANC